MIIRPVSRYRGVRDLYNIIQASEQGYACSELWMQCRCPRGCLQAYLILLPRTVRNHRISVNLLISGSTRWECLHRREAYVVVHVDLEVQRCPIPIDRIGNLSGEHRRTSGSVYVVTSKASETPRFLCCPVLILFVLCYIIICNIDPLVLLLTHILVQYGTVLHVQFCSNLSSIRKSQKPIRVSCRRDSAIALHHIQEQSEGKNEQQYIYVDFQLCMPWHVQIHCFLHFLGGGSIRITTSLHTLDQIVWSSHPKRDGSDQTKQKESSKKQSELTHTKPNSRAVCER